MTFSDPLDQRVDSEMARLELELLFGNSDQLAERSEIENHHGHLIAQYHFLHRSATSDPRTPATEHVAPQGRWPAVVTFEGREIGRIYQPIKNHCRHPDGFERVRRST